MAPLTLTPLSSLNISTHQIPTHSNLPNTTPHSHPLLIYHRAFPPSTPPSALESHLPINLITPQWRFTMYATTHYHSNTHEVLCAYSGRARLLFGGEKNPGKVEAEVGAGDMVVVPAGVGHRLAEDLSSGGEGFMMVGGYPRGCSWDMCYGEEGEDNVEAVKSVQWLRKDPLYGDDGPVIWGGGEGEKA